MCMKYRGDRICTFVDTPACLAGLSVDWLRYITLTKVGGRLEARWVHSLTDSSPLRKLVDSLAIALLLPIINSVLVFG